jgi:hypothetical protein
MEVKAFKLTAQPAVAADEPLNGNTVSRTMRPSRQEINQATVYWILIGLTILGFATGVDWLAILGIIGMVGFSAMLNSIDE